MPKFPLPARNTRLGFHYFPDTNHYRQTDLQTWLPILSSLGTSWLTLQAPLDRAIPEYFLSSIISEGIEPILHLPFSLHDPPQPKEMVLLFSTYARWGVHYLVMFDRPNSRDAWPTAAWVQNELVERFLDRFIPTAREALKCGLTPVFPPLQPGGDYWDTTFLQAALQGLRRRNHRDLVENLVLSAYCPAGDRPLNWGAGGPERWPGARPYYTPPNQQDQIGLRIFDWYLTISQAVLGKPAPLILFGAGSYPSSTASGNSATREEGFHAGRNLAIIQSLLDTPKGITSQRGSRQEHPGLVPDQVLACNFWLLSTAPEGPHLAQAWFKPGGQTLSIVQNLRQWLAESASADQILAGLDPAETTSPDAAASQSSQDLKHAIAHYLLLPLFDWGVSDWYLDAIRPFVKKYHPTIGFSIEEAAHAARVTVVGSRQLIPDSLINRLRASGCKVERIDGDGTSIATTLALYR